MGELGCISGGAGARSGSVIGDGVACLQKFEDML